MFTKVDVFSMRYKYWRQLIGANWLSFTSWFTDTSYVKIKYCVGENREHTVNYMQTRGPLFIVRIWNIYTQIELYLSNNMNYVVPGPLASLKFRSANNMFQLSSAYSTKIRYVYFPKPQQNRNRIMNTN